MERYKIYCTIEQVQRAIKLNAPIKECMSRYNAKTAYLEIAKGNSSLDEYQKKGIAIIKTSCSVRAYKIPTAEEMIGWLEEKLHEVFIIHPDNVWHYSVIVNQDKLVPEEKTSNSRKEATLAAIDAALKYLSEK